MFRPFPHKTFRIAGLAIVALMLIVGGIGIQFSRHYKAQIRARLPALAAKATDSLYDITVQDIRINIFTRVVTVYGLRMSANPDVLSRRRSAGRPPHVVLDVTVPTATIAGVRWRELDAERALDCRSVRFTRPEIRVQILPEWDAHDTARRRSSAAIRKVSAGRIYIDDPVIDVRYNAGSEAFSVQASGGTITARDWNFLPRQPFDTARFFGALKAGISLKNIVYTHPGALYRFTLGSLAFSTESSGATIRDLQVTPAGSYEWMYSRMGRRADIYKYSLPQAVIDSLDWKALLAAHSLKIGRIRMNAPQLSIYLSKKLPPRADSIRPPYFYQRLQALSMPVTVGSIGFWDAEVKYSEASRKTGATGNILFNYLRGAAYNVTNDPRRIARTPQCKILVSGKFMYRSDLAAILDIDLASRRGAFSLNGALHNVDASQIRAPVSAMALATVTSLKLKSGHVRIRGNEDSTWGQYSIAYNYLRVGLKKWDESDSDTHSRVLLSFLANKLLLYTANPMPGESLRSATTAVARGDTRSFFRTIWKNIFRGITQTAIREEGAYAIAKRRVENKDKPRRKFFRNLFPKRKKPKPRS